MRSISLGQDLESFIVPSTSTLPLVCKVENSHVGWGKYIHNIDYCLWVVLTFKGWQFKDGTFIVWLCKTKCFMRFSQIVKDYVSQLVKITYIGPKVALLVTNERDYFLAFLKHYSSNKFPYRDLQRFLSMVTKPIDIEQRCFHNTNENIKAFPIFPKAI